MASMNTRLNIENLDGNILQKHGGTKQVGFKQLGPCVKAGIHGVRVQKCVWFEVGLQGAQENREAEVHHSANVGAFIMKIGVPGQEGTKGNAAERYRGDNNMAALGVAAVIEEYAHESLTFRDAVACEVISKWISVMKEDIVTRSSMCMLSNGFRRSSDDSNIYYWKHAPGMFIYLFLYIDYMGFTCESKAEIWVTKGLLDEAKEIILGMEIFRTQSGNTLRVSRFRFSNGMSVQILLGGHSTLSLEGGLSENRDEEKKKSGFELRLVAGIATCALTKVVPSLRFRRWLKLLRIEKG
ncbi:hypothetical protein Tco_1042591 [Tanacetum coccineum]|uniref:Uncharacterized protein n=1 Tax=Tanacetum coccineum TaxID=301880 RepID=A0ABQ5GKX8_9ASTR